MRIPFLLLILLLAACANSPPAPPPPHAVTFTGDYLDARKNIAVKTYLHPIHLEPPAVPMALRRNGGDASAVIAFMVEQDGTTSQAQVVSTTDEAFGEAARQSVLRRRYAPPRKGSQAVRIAVEEPFGFMSNR